jgi:predicted AAA+ superfamily ATPase
MNEYLETGYSLHYWRTANQIEVDFVLYGEKGLVAIEVKRAATLRRSDFKGLVEFKKDYPMARAIMLYGGNRLMSEQNSIEVVPIDFFLRNLGEFLN